MKIRMAMGTVIGTMLLGTALWAADAAVGTWKLNVAKSKFAAGNEMTSGTMTLEETADGIKRTGEAVRADGKTTSMGYVAKVDGKDYPVTGSDVFDTIALKRINDRTVAVTLKKSGKIVGTGRRAVSADGKVLTLRATGTNAKGQKVKGVQVYDKE